MATLLNVDEARWAASAACRSAAALAAASARESWSFSFDTSDRCSEIPERISDFLCANRSTSAWRLFTATRRSAAARRAICLFTWAWVATSESDPTRVERKVKRSENWAREVDPRMTSSSDPAPVNSFTMREASNACAA